MARNTPAESLLKGFANDFADYYVVLSDVLRQLVLYKFGGIYLDTDIISIKKIPRIPEFTNFLARDEYNADSDQDNINNAVIGFRNPGNEYLKKLIKLIVDEFKPTQWGHNGPRAVTKMAQIYCGSKHLVQMPNNCSINFLPENSFYPVYYYRWRTLFDPKMNQEIINITANSIGVHFYNHLSQFTHFTGENQPLLKLAKQNCPITYVSKIKPTIKS